jgi:tetratricopeptide (TPR) repeat protein
MAQDLSTNNRRAAKLFEEGQSFYQKHQHQEAEKVLLEALEKDNFVEARTLLGYVYLDLMQYQKAKAQFAQAIDINAKAIPNNLFFLAELELKDGEYESAQKHFNAFLESNPQNSEQLNRSKNGLEVIDFALKAQKNPVPFEPKNLGPSFNSEQAEYFPSLTVDGNTLLFTRRLPSKSSPMGYNEDFYLAQRNEKGHWQKAQNMGQPINTANNEGAPSFSADGNMLIFTACELYGDYGGNRKGYGSCDLFITFKGDANLWGKPKNLGSTINSAHWETQPSFSADGKTLYFVQGKRNRSGSQNGNIYVSRLNEEGRWTVPQALSNKINTIGNEESVFIHPDGKTLYFSSDGHLGMGGLDIFMSQKDSSGEWSEPLNLGYPINTHKNENSLLVSPDGELAYFASDRKEGYGDFTSITIDLARGQEYTVTVGMEYHFAGQDSVTAWIDYNYDATFSTEEQIVFGTLDAEHSATAAFTVPMDALMDKPMRMRVRSQYFGNTMRSCDETAGEVEDYSINITENPFVAVTEIVAIEGSVSPNPSNGIFTIGLTEIAQNIAVEMYDITGKIVAQNVYHQTDAIQVSTELATGTYLLKITTEKGTKTQKVIIK